MKSFVTMNSSVVFAFLAAAVCWVSFAHATPYNDCTKNNSSAFNNEAVRSCRGADLNNMTNCKNIAIAAAMKKLCGAPPPITIPSNFIVQQAPASPKADSRYLPKGITVNNAPQDFIEAQKIYIKLKMACDEILSGQRGSGYPSAKQYCPKGDQIYYNRPMGSSWGEVRLLLTNYYNDATKKK